MKKKKKNEKYTSPVAGSTRFIGSSRALPGLQTSLTTIHTGPVLNSYRNYVRCTQYSIVLVHKTIKKTPDPFFPSLHTLYPPNG